MRKLGLLIIAIATLCALALGALALANRTAPNPGDDVIIIKGGSLEVQCPTNGDKACLGVADATGKYKATKSTAHVTNIVVKDNTGATLFSNAFDPAHQPSIEVTYK